MRAGIDCVAVTDHNSGAWVDLLKSALKELEEQQHPDFRPLHLFPGVEITANGGTHVLAVFDPSRTTSDVDQLTGAVQYGGEPGKSDRASDYSVLQVVEQIVDRGGIAIPAHADRDRGLWSLTGNTLEPVLTSGDVFAVEIADMSASKPDLYRQHKLDWATVLGSDSHRLSGAGDQHFPGTHFTWVKMEEPSIEGLRLALLDGERFSIRRSDDADPPAQEPPAHHLRAIEVEKAQLMGLGEPATLNFSPWLNVLIGGRGTGKSTVLHCLRLAARRESELRRLDDRSNARTTFERFSRVPTARNSDGGLRKETHIKWTVSRYGVAHRVHWRAQPDAEDTIVEDETDVGSWVASQAQHVSEDRFPIRLFSQGQIAELAGDNQAALLDLIDEGAGSADCKQALEEAQRAVMMTRARIREIDAKLTRRENISVALGDNERKLAAFEDSGHAETLRAYRRGERQQRELDRHFDIALRAAQRVDDLAGALQAEDIGGDVFDGADSNEGDAVAIIEATHRAMEDATSQLRQAAEQLREAVAEKRSELSASTWQRGLDDVVAEYSALAESLGEDAVGDPTQHASLLQERQQLITIQEELDSLEDDRQRLVGEEANHLADLVRTRRALSSVRVAFLEETLGQNEFVRIQLVPYGDNLRAAELSLRGALGVDNFSFERDVGGAQEAAPDHAIINHLLTGLPDDLDLRSDEFERRLAELRRQFTDSCSGKGDVFGARFSRHLESKHEQSPEFLDRLVTWFPPDSLYVEHRLTGENNEFRPIGQGSAGQRAAAMLAFLLAHGVEPLVLDQPEDDLDNQLIYDLVVRQIRENKLRRQIIAVTHNPNIVVNGDAEMVNVLDFEGGQCRVVHSGSLQGTEMRDHVCRVMEGGREALERRYRRLEAGPSDV